MDAYRPYMNVADDPDTYYPRVHPTRNVLANFIIGASVSLVASCLSSLGVNLQAAALRAQRERNLAEEREAGEEDLASSDEDDPSSPTRLAERGRPNPHTYGTLGGSPNGTSRNNSAQSSRGETLPSPPLSSAAVMRVQEKLGRNTWRDLFERWQWHIGFSLYLIFQLSGSVIALIFLSPVMLAPLGSASLIFNAIFSRLFLGTRITRLDGVGTVLVVIGCAIVSTFGSGEKEENPTIDDLIKLFQRPIFIIYFSIQTLLVVFIFSFIKYLEYGIGALKFFTLIYRRSDQGETAPLLNPVRRVSSNSVLDLAAKVKGDWLGALYGVVGGTVASQTLLLTKSGVQLLIVSIFQSDNQFRGAFSFALLSLLCLTVFVQLYSLNRGLHYSLPNIIVPIFYTFFTVLSLSNTLVYMDQFDDYNTLHLVCIAIGISLIIIGVFFLTRGNAATGDESEGVFDSGRSSGSDFQASSGSDQQRSNSDAVPLGVDISEDARRRKGHISDTE
ncbi:hypothetical protein DFS34DRAFT_599475 [Phlyctochytrium arcticum]|nr:hypothetical protein DFS34DRAFT_599475 [Phlyctochytrium arcticum]